MSENPDRGHVLAGGSVFGWVRWAFETAGASEAGMSDEMKPVPNDTAVPPAMDADRRHDTNLAPQGPMHPDAPPESKFTPEGDGEPAPNIPPSATDPYGDEV